MASKGSSAYYTLKRKPLRSVGTLSYVGVFWDEQADEAKRATTRIVINGQYFPIDVQ